MPPPVSPFCLIREGIWSWWQWGSDIGSGNSCDGVVIRYILTCKVTEMVLIGIPSLILSTWTVSLTGEPDMIHCLLVHFPSSFSSEFRCHVDISYLCLALQPQVPVVVNICKEKKKSEIQLYFMLILMDPEDVSKSYKIKGLFMIGERFSLNPKTLA